MVWETKVQSQVTSYQRHKKWYLMPSCLTLSTIRYELKANPGKGVALSLTPQCSSYWKRTLQVALDYVWPTYNCLELVWIQSLPSPRQVVISKWKNPIYSTILPIAGGRRDGFLPFPGAVVQSEIQTALSRIWTWVMFNSWVCNCYA